MANDKIKKAKSKAVKAGKKAAATIVSNPISTAYVVGGLLAVFVGYKLYKSATSGKDDNGQQLDTSHNSNNLTISEQQANNLAAQLLNAMSRYGKDAATMESVFDLLKTGDDFKLVAKKFGTKLYNGAGLPPEGLPGWLDGATPLNLVDWLSEEVGSIFSPVLYRKVKERVESAGFAFA